MTHGGQLRIIDLGLSFRLSHTKSSVLRPFAGRNIFNKIFSLNSIIKVHRNTCHLKYVK
jgi:hypothetical protein